MEGGGELQTACFFRQSVLKNSLSLHHSIKQFGSRSARPNVFVGLDLNPFTVAHDQFRKNYNFILPSF